MLKTYHTITDLQQILFPLKQSGHSIGFVPTMGALHAGHLSLIAESRRQCSHTVSSIFVNPGQFNDPLDFDKYPRDGENDTRMLSQAGCDFLFMPGVREIYPADSYKHIDFDPGELGKRLEGKYRPGHFEGMVAVVKRLFDIVKPDKAFFGQKDYQQYLMVKKMTAFYNMPVEIVRCPIIREENGLAMSSRNQRLTENQRERAALIYKTLTQAAHQVNEARLSFEEIKSSARAILEQDGNFTVDYFDICSANDLEPATVKNKNNELVILTAVYMGQVRLIDNILI